LTNNQIHRAAEAVNGVAGSAMLGTLVKGLGHDHAVWATDLVLYASRQSQIKAMRRIEIPRDA
jgi:hypothetical protein